MQLFEKKFLKLFYYKQSQVIRNITSMKYMIDTGIY